MRKYVCFDSIRSDQDLDLYLGSVSVGSPAVRTNYVDIPGADGLLDLSEALGGVTYGSREIMLSFGRAIYDRYQQDAIVKNALHGKRMKITLSEDPSHSFLGRVSVVEWQRVNGVGHVDISATCDPYRYKAAPTTVTGTVPESGTLSLTLANERRPVVPTVEVSAAATLTFGGKDIAVAAGSHRSLDIRLAAGSNTLAVTAAAGTTVSVTYQEASL